MINPVHYIISINDFHFLCVSFTVGATHKPVHWVRLNITADSTLFPGYCSLLLFDMNDVNHCEAFLEKVGMYCPFLWRLCCYLTNGFFSCVKRLIHIGYSLTF